MYLIDHWWQNLSPRRPLSSRAEVLLRSREPLGVADAMIEAKPRYSTTLTFLERYPLVMFLRRYDSFPPQRLC